MAAREEAVARGRGETKNDRRAEASPQSNAHALDFLACSRPIAKRG
jgi:hypothetical protein